MMLISRREFCRRVVQVFFQFALCILVGAIFAAIETKLAGVSALMGALVYTVPNTLFTRLAFSFTGARQATKVYRSFALGLLLKMGLLAVLVASVATYPLDWMAFGVGFGVIVMSHWLAPLFFHQQ